jgi:hypothetical protein
MALNTELGRARHRRESKRTRRSSAGRCPMPRKGAGAARVPQVVRVQRARPPFAGTAALGSRAGSGDASSSAATSLRTISWSRNFDVIVEAADALPHTIPIDAMRAQRLARGRSTSPRTSACRSYCPVPRLPAAAPRCCARSRRPAARRVGEPIFRSGFIEVDGAEDRAPGIGACSGTAARRRAADAVSRGKL